MLYWTWPEWPVDDVLLDHNRLRTSFLDENMRYVDMHTSNVLYLIGREQAFAVRNNSERGGKKWDSFP